jgi:murein DD-endopeptidase MepM/ murein hydrolase activator NlpD
MVLFSMPAEAAPQFLNFPVSGYGPYTPALVSTVLDHEVPHDLTQQYLPFMQPSTLGPYGYSGGVLSFTGELFLAAPPAYPNQNLGCYPKPTNAHQTSVWSATLTSIYYGTSTGGTGGNCLVGVALNYDNHPGYDYKIPGGSAVHPAANGNIIFTKCIRTFTNSTASNGCELYGAVAVDHGNGFVTQYLHMANLSYGMAAFGFNQPVTTSWTLGTVSNVGVTAIHLHFEVLQRKAVAVDPNNYYARANYMIVDPYGYNTASYYADLLQSKPGCLWAAGCHY